VERVLTDSEKIRKAEDIYFKRNNIIRNNANHEKKSSIKDKFLLHFIIVINIIVIVFFIQNRDFIFTNEFLENINKYNISIKDKIVSFVGNIINADNQSIVEENDIKDDIDNNNAIEEVITFEEDASSLNEQDEDVQNLKASYSFIKPVEGIITSHFGTRTSQYKNVPSYHTGTDISAPIGTQINASMGGIVTLVSNIGDYGKHVKIRSNNVSTLYAHCSKIYVKEGQIVAQGQAIGEVGNTGNSTGPHLHFEIRIDDKRFVNPEEIIWS